MRYLTVRRYPHRSAPRSRRSGDRVSPPRRVTVTGGDRRFACLHQGQRRRMGSDHWRAGGVVVAPAFGLVEQPTAGDQRAAARRELLQHRGACGINREAHVLLRARCHDVAAPVPVEQLRRVVVGLGDEPVRDITCASAPWPCPYDWLAPPIHRSTTGLSRGAAQVGGRLPRSGRRVSAAGSRFPAEPWRRRWSTASTYPGGARR